MLFGMIQTLPGTAPLRHAAACKPTVAITPQQSLIDEQQGQQQEQQRNNRGTLSIDIPTV
jgi:hypothetical protein